MDPGKPAAFDPDEAARLRELAALDIVDSPAEADADEIAELAARICQTPMSTITFVDQARQWFKARVGLKLAETRREIAFCSHTIQLPGGLVIADARQDARFRSNPLVTGDPGIVFYTGYPLITGQGHAVGTIAVMDTRPRQLEGHQHAALRLLARQVVKWLESRRNESLLRLLANERQEVNECLRQTRQELEQQLSSNSSALQEALARHNRSERLYRTLWETTTDAVLIIDARSQIRFANPSSQAMFGYAPDELVGRPLAFLQPERFRSAHVKAMSRYLESGVRRMDWRATEVMALRKEGSEFPVEIAFSEIGLEGERGFVGFFRDITDRKRAELVLFDEKERAQATLRSIGDGVVVVDEVGCITFLNPVAEALTGWTNEDAIGLGHDQVLVLEDPEGFLGYGPLPDDASGPVPLSAKPLCLQPKSGPTVHVEGKITQLRDKTGRRAGSVVAFRDVSAWRRLTAQLTHQATHDHLTGLINRGELERRLQALIDAAEDESIPHSLLYLDLDQFKVVNDTSGHVAGDELLRQLAEALKHHLRSSDTLARLGGDEFAVLLENCPSTQALQIAEKLREAVAEYAFYWDGKLFNVGVSVGHVYFAGKALSLARILSHADEACYMAKDLGRNRIHTYQPGDEELAKRHGEMEWVALIRMALKEGRFVLYGQDIFNLADPSAPPHVEMLLRMRDEAGQIVPPMSFIPAAEHFNLMPAIDRWVISAVCVQLGKLIAGDPAKKACCYAINLSGGSVTDAHLAEFIVDALRTNGVPGHCVCFEITETAAIGNLAHAVKLIQDLKAHGCKFSLDDFGSGMSSFAYLKRLPVDYLKIDGEFVRNIAEDPIDKAMVTAIHQIGRLMGLKTIAEFVENDRVLAVLREIGVDYGQGYGLAKPRPMF